MSSDTNNVTFELHEAVFKNDVSGTIKFLNQLGGDHDFENMKDIHGNTPLHLAVMLGHKECVESLVKHRHGVFMKNGAGWTPLQEAVSYGNREIINCLNRSLREQNKSSMKLKKPKIRDALQSFKQDFYLEMRWDFQSWLPFVSRILPSDICHIYRSGSRIRMDSTLEDFSDKRWVRGDLTFIIDFDTDVEPSVLLLDNVKKCYQSMEQTTVEHEASIEDESDIAMTSDIVDAALKTKDAVIEPVKTGWIFRQDKTERIGDFNADVYKVSGLNYVTRKRREHLSDEDLKKNKMLKDALSLGKDSTGLLEKNEDQEHRKSLPPPNKPNVTWDEYISSPAGCSPTLGREIKEKINQKSFEAKIAISSEFPIQLETLLPILAALGPKAKFFGKIKDFVTIRLPPGFPVRLDIPVLPTIKATVNFPQFEFKEKLPESMFSVPADYKLEPGWFDRKNKDRRRSSKKL